MVSDSDMNAMKTKQTMYPFFSFLLQAPQRKKRPVRKRTFKKHNDHMAQVLKDYSEDTNK